MVRAMHLGLPAWPLIACAAVAVILVMKRRRRQALTVIRAPRQFVPAARQVIYPPVYPAAVQRSGGGHAGRYIWGLVVVLIVLGAAALGLTRRTAFYDRQAFSPAIRAVPASDFTWVQDAAPPAVPEPRFTPPAAPEPPAYRAAKPENWMKKKKAPPVQTTPGPAWAGNFERNCIAPLADSREEILETVRQGLARTLNLRQAPSPEFVGNAGWVRISETERKPLEKQDEIVGDVVHINYHVEMTDEGAAELTREQRADRAGERLGLALGGLGLLTALLGAVAAYIRLDEWTKGYYSGRLFLAATILVAVFGVVIEHWLRSSGR
jgi:hypothetical protein